MTMLNADQVIERMKDIGPHVYHDVREVEGRYLHQFRVQDVPFGRPKHVALMAVFSDTEELALADDQIDLVEGRKRYQND